jgi:medium-chain acyl-[acyl-carrier-protein] hydrolase
MVLFPYAGAGASIYRSWSKFFSSQFECFAVQPPGRETRFSEALLTSVGDYAKHASAAIACLPDDRPLILFGHSLGALAAYETAVELSHCGRSLACLVVSGRQDPDTPSKRKHISHLEDDEFVRQMATYNGTPAQVLENTELLELLLPMIKADFSMSEKYAGRSKTVLDCPVLALGSHDDDWLDANAVKRWSEVSTGKFVERWFAGDHFYLNHHTSELVEFLTQHISLLYKRP